MFEKQFLTLFHTIEMIDAHVEHANPAERAQFLEKLSEIRELSTSWLNRWMELEEKITDTFDKLTVQKGQSTRTGFDASVKIRFTPDPEPVQLESVIFDMANETEVSLRKGLAYFELFMFKEAADELEQVEKTPEATLFLAASYAVTGRLLQAQREIENVKGQFHDAKLTCATAEIDAYIQLRSGNLEGAIRSYLDALSAMPLYTDVWFNLGACYLASHDPIAAERMLAHFLKQHPNDCEATLLHICALIHQGKYADSLERCTKADRIFPDYFDLKVAYSYVCQATGQMTLGESLSRQMMIQYPNQAQGYLHASWYALQKGEMEHSTTILKKLLSLQPNHSIGLLQLTASQLINPKRTDKVKMMTVIENNTPYVELLSIVTGMIRVREASIDEVLQNFELGIQSAHPSIRRLASYTCGVYLAKDHRLTDAMRYLLAANASGPPNYAILTALHETASMLGWHDEAKSFLEQAILAKEKDLLKCN